MQGENLKKAGTLKASLKVSKETPATRISFTNRFSICIFTKGFPDYPSWSLEGH